MIAKYRFCVKAQDALPASRAYAFYSCLMDMLPSEVANCLHEQGEHPVSQFLHYYRERNEQIWQISLLDSEYYAEMASVLDDISFLELNTGRVPLNLLEKIEYDTSDFISEACSKPIQKRTTFNVLSPAAFKQNGRYTIIPQERLILQSLLNKWNSVFSEYPLDDEDAIHLLENGLHIVDYSLRSTRFALKDSKIPGFFGSLTLDARLSPPIMEIWNLLVQFSEFCGVGMKTALGMGGVSVQPIKDNESKCTT